MSLSIPYTFTGGPGNYIIAAQVNANFQSIAGKFTEGVGGISDGDIATSAAIKGTKLTNVAGNRIPYDRYETNSIGPRPDGTNPLYTDANDSNDASRAVGTNSIQNLAITSAKLGNLAVLSGKMKVTSCTQTVSGILIGTGGAITGSRLAFSYPASGFSPALPTLANMGLWSAWLSNVSGYPVAGSQAYLPTVQITFDLSGVPTVQLMCHVHSGSYNLTATMNVAYVAAS